jgi:hypothetical protein
MPCELCADLCVRYPIRQPNDLIKAIKIAKQNVEDGTIIELPDFESINQNSFAVVASGEAWGDIIEYNFCCSSCGERFSLHAETYHGSGGYWEPKNKSSVRENL